MKQILYDNYIFLFDNNSIYGPNDIVISETEWVNKKGGSRGEGLGHNWNKNIALYNVFDHLQFFSPCKINCFAADVTPPLPLHGKFHDNNLL